MKEKSASLNKPIYELNNNCIKIISKFGRLIKRLDNTLILLQDRHVLKKVIYHANRTNDPELLKLAALLVQEIDQPRNKLQSKNTKQINTLLRTTKTANPFSKSA